MLGYAEQRASSSLPPLAVHQKRHPLTVPLAPRTFLPSIKPASHNLQEMFEQLMVDMRTRTQSIEIINRLAAYSAAGGTVDTANEHGDTLLLEAASRALVVVVNYLVRQGANPNQANSKGFTPLMAAVSAGDSATVAALLHAGADVNKGDMWGRTALLRSVELHEHQYIITEMLLRTGARVDVQENDGLTPLMVAAQRGDFSMVMLLLQHGASTFLKNKEGQTAFDLAKKSTNIKSEMRQWCTDPRHVRQCGKVLPRIPGSKSDTALTTVTPSSLLRVQHSTGELSTSTSRLPLGAEASDRYIPRSGAHAHPSRPQEEQPEHLSPQMRRFLRRNGGAE